MSNITSLEIRISEAEDSLAFFTDKLKTLKAEFEEFKQQHQEQEQEQEQENLLGRCATHPEYGRGIIVSDNPDTFKQVRFMVRNDEFTDGADRFFVNFDDLTLDPVTLTTGQDFEDAPEGTIVEDITNPRCVAMKIRGTWCLVGLGGVALTSEDMSACRVIRWGNGK